MLGCVVLYRDADLALFYFCWCGFCCLGTLANLGSIARRLVNWRVSAVHDCSFSVPSSGGICVNGSGRGQQRPLRLA